MLTTLSIVSLDQGKIYKSVPPLSESVGAVEFAPVELPSAAARPMMPLPLIARLRAWAETANIKPGLIAKAE